jgi:adenine-specific DNA-methyltransferase
VIERLLAPVPCGPDFITATFNGIFYSIYDLRFLDSISANIEKLEHPHERAMARAALIRSCLKKQPRGVFTVSGDLSHYDDGRRDLRLSLREHFIEQAQVFNSLAFNNGHQSIVSRANVFDLDPRGIDLAYLDPPYVPRSDDNCYIKRYHFLEGLSCYWHNLRIMEHTKVKKIEKARTPFGYRKTALDAFDRLFNLYRDSIIVLSYSSNGYPDLAELEMLMRRYKRDIVIHRKSHRYHFGTHSSVERAAVYEYLIVGR